jgi:hypothetical protein
MMKLRYNGSEAMNLELAEHRDGNAMLAEKDEFEVTNELGKKLLASSSLYEEIGKGDKS